MRKDIRIYEKDEIVQGTPEWFKVRELKFTASHASEIGANGKGLETLVKELLAEHYSSQEYEEYTGKYKSPAMQRGNDFEATARMVYEFETGNSVREVGFVELDDRIGCSPDGIVTEANVENGLIEIKNHDDKVFLELVLTGEVNSKYEKQMQYQMWVTGADWCDYFGFNPNFKPNYYKKRYLPDLALFKKFEAGTEDGKKMIEKGLGILEEKLQVLPKENKEKETNEARTEEKPAQKTEEIKKVETIEDDFPF